MTATETATNSHKEKGIRELTDAAHRNAPFELTVYHDKKRTRSYHPTLAAAVKARSAARQVKRRDGTAAMTYDRAAHSEYAEAKKIVGDTPLRDVATFYADRQSSASKEKVPTVNEAVAKIIEVKEKIGRSDRTVADFKYRLGLFAKEFDGRLISSPTRNEILDWVLAQPGSARSTHNLFNNIQTLMRYAERRDWIIVDPTRKIERDSDLPTIKKGRVGFLSIPQAHGLLRLIESEFVEYMHWVLVKYFAGIRAAESERFHGEWIDVEQKRIVIPGWAIDDEGEPTPGSKTRDDWPIDNIQPEFWEWLKAYPPPRGPIQFPSKRSWASIRKRLAALPAPAKIKSWPNNAMRHTFATYDLSAFRDQDATSLKIRHQSPRKLWSNYFAYLIPEARALLYYKILPSKK